MVGTRNALVALATVAAWVGCASSAQAPPDGAGSGNIAVGVACSNSGNKVGFGCENAGSLLVCAGGRWAPLSACPPGTACREGACVGSDGSVAFSLPAPDTPGAGTAATEERTATTSSSSSTAAADQSLDASDEFENASTLSQYASTESSASIGWFESLKGAGSRTAAPLGAGATWVPGLLALGAAWVLAAGP
ncbi:hypothetical protein H4R18_005958 [Coemansia javaensis]|uniref:Uncharacterized protein n=1 Tax=Coemansia javaensis TaxID=2761396 RepID=A0A9W8LEU9_9FUNG|nr:hypothetical protein H4R18_005958 [Coemansia javaensis]